MLKAFKEHIENRLSFLETSKLLIAISGGLDSVVLTHLCCQLKLNVSLAHCNFNLRGKESDADEDFVLQLAEDLELEVFIESFDTENYAKENKQSIQMAARELRYNWFQELAGQLHFDYILTAHHADDNLETFLINLTRGTGLDGLTGIPEINKNIVRPLLPFSREQLESYATSYHLQWREDSSNASTKYLRNKLRHEVIPVLKDINPLLLQNIDKTQKHLKDSKKIIEEALKKVHKNTVSVEKDRILFNISRLQKLANRKAYLYEFLNDFGFTEWDDVNNLLEAQSGKFVFSATHRLIKDREHLILTEINTSDNSESFMIFNENESLETPLGILDFELVKEIGQPNKRTLYVDKDLLKYPLSVRKWQKGDYFYPFGMTGKKKLSKYFKDEKWSMPEKESTWLLFANNEIVWIVGNRADNRYRVTENTKQILKIALK